MFRYNIANFLNDKNTHKILKSIKYKLFDLNKNGEFSQKQTMDTREFIQEIIYHIFY